jgi:hypothetical protein
VREVLDLHGARELLEAIDGVAGEKRFDRVLDRVRLRAARQAGEEGRQQIVVNVERGTYGISMADGSDDSTVSIAPRAPPWQRARSPAIHRRART